MSAIPSGSDERNYYWFDTDGKLLCKTLDHGNLIVEDDKMYFFKKYDITVLDKAGNVTETIEDLSAFSQIKASGDKWYIVLVMSDYSEYHGKSVLYSNGLELLFPGKTAGGSMAICDDGVFAVGGVYFKEDGTEIYDMSDSLLVVEAYHGFRNGFAKINNVLENEFGFIDTDGNFVLTTTKDGLGNYGEVYPGDLIPYRQNGLWGAIDIQGNLIWEPKYEKFGF